MFWLKQNFIFKHFIFCTLLDVASVSHPPIYVSFLDESPVRHLPGKD